MSGMVGDFRAAIAAGQGGQALSRAIQERTGPIRWKPDYLGAYPPVEPYDLSDIYAAYEEARMAAPPAPKGDTDA